MHVRMPVSPFRYIWTFALEVIRISRHTHMLIYTHACALTSILIDYYSFPSYLTNCCPIAFISNILKAMETAITNWICIVLNFSLMITSRTSFCKAEYTESLRCHIIHHLTLDFRGCYAFTFLVKKELCAESRTWISCQNCTSVDVTHPSSLVLVNVKLRINDFTVTSQNTYQYVDQTKPLIFL